jgi:hypothetical protein
MSPIQLGGSRKQGLKISHPTSFKNLDKETQTSNGTTPEEDIKELLDAATRALKSPAHSQLIRGSHKVDGHSTD